MPRAASSAREPVGNGVHLHLGPVAQAHDGALAESSSQSEARAVSSAFLLSLAGVGLSYGALSAFAMVNLPLPSQLCQHGPEDARRRLAACLQDVVRPWASKHRSGPRPPGPGRTQRPDVPAGLDGAGVKFSGDGPVEVQPVLAAVQGHMDGSNSRTDREPAPPSRPG